MSNAEGSLTLVEVMEQSLACSSAPELLGSVLGPLRRISGAGAAVVVAASLEGPVVAYSDGLELPAWPVQEMLSAAPGTGTESVESPPQWRQAGISRVLAQRLPGHAGVLLLGWAGSDGADGADGAGGDSTLTAALGTVLVALGRIEAEGALEDLTLRVAGAQHLAGMGDYDWHIASDTNRWSDQLYRIYGYEPQSFNASYERFLSSIHPDDRERIQAVHQRAYATGEPYTMIERIVRPDGEIRHLSSSGEVILDSDGTPVRMRGTCIDITDRVLADQERALVAERFRGLVSASPEAILVLDADQNIAHANPCARALLGGDPVSRPVSEVLPNGLVSDRGVHALGIDGAALTLDVTQVEMSAADPQARTALFLSDALPRLEREAFAQRLGAYRHSRRQALEINDNVVQGLTAAMYALEQGDVDLVESLLGRTIEAGRAMMDDLLEPSLHGLAAGDLVRAAATGATRVAERDAEIRGAESSADQSAAEDPAPVVPVVPRVLIVDDSEDLRMLLRLQLGRQGRFEVVGEAVDGLDGVEQAGLLQPDLVLLDMAMPRMDGLQALPLIRAAVPAARVVVLSGFNQATLEKEALEAGADRYVTKGGKLPDLLAVLASVLEAA